MPNTKRAGGVAQSVGPEFKPQYHKKKKKNTIAPQLLDSCFQRSSFSAPISSIF
jgi:hypothetical protein